MNIIDSKGRLFGVVSILDLGAGLVILLVIIGIFIVPGPTGSVAQSQTKAVEVDLMVRSLGVYNLDNLLKGFEKEKKANIIIRNQPSGTVNVQSVQELPQSVSVPQPDGSVQAFPDPRPELEYIHDLLITVIGNGQITDNGAVLGNQKVKIGSVIELDGPNYNLRCTIVGVHF